MSSGLRCARICMVILQDTMEEQPLCSIRLHQPREIRFRGSGLTACTISSDDSDTSCRGMSEWIIRNRETRGQFQTVTFNPFTLHH
jgi:hypothetical protein